MYDEQARSLTEPLEYFSAGFVEEPGWQGGATKAVLAALAKAAAAGPLTCDDLEGLMQRSLTQWLSRRHRRTPIITAIVVNA